MITAPQTQPDAATFRSSQPSLQSSSHVADAVLPQDHVDYRLRRTEAHSSKQLEEMQQRLELAEAAAATSEREKVAMQATLKQATADDLLTKLKACSPAFFESIVVKLLMAMGYGGIAGEGTVTGRSGDQSRSGACPATDA